MRKSFLFIIFGILLFGKIVGAEDGVGQQFEGFNLEGYTEEGEKSWDINGDTADVVGSAIEIENVIANSYGKAAMNVTAERGSIDQSNGRVNLQKDVIVTSERGAQLITESLNWDKDLDKLSTDDDVMLTDEGVMMTGRGMQANPGLHTAEIKKDVTVRVNSKPKEQKPQQNVTITSDGPMVLDKLLAKATFEDNVVAIQEKRILKSDKMEIYFDDGFNEINDIVCIGNVVITEGDNKTYAERAVYKAGEEKLVLTGRPKLIFSTEGNNVFTAPGN